MSISTFSLVAIAIERYSAICNPLKSRVWQTRSHAYRVIAATWVLAFLIMIPYPIISHLDSFQGPNNTTAHQCRHKWPIATAEQTWWVHRLFLINQEQINSSLPSVLLPAAQMSASEVSDQVIICLICKCCNYTQWFFLKGTNQ